MLTWRATLYLYDDTCKVKTGFMNYSRGILQGDTISRILFVISVNPLSHLLEKQEDYKAGSPNRTMDIGHLFVDDLKVYAPNIQKLKEMLYTVTQFSNDIGMNF